MVKVALLLSGGLDSTVLGCSFDALGYVVRPLSIHYGQRHARELEAAAAICKARGWPYTQLTIPGVQVVKPPIPDGHYNDERMKAMVSPNRNMILLAYATAWAMVEGCERVAYAAHGGDHAIYPDCRPEFVAVLREAIRVGNWNAPDLVAPFVHWTKTQIVARGAELGAPLALTWSCYRGEALHCGTCGTCVERREAFRDARLFDPTEYEAR